MFVVGFWIGAGDESRKEFSTEDDGEGEIIEEVAEDEE